MKKSLFFDFSVDKTTNTIIVKREFAAQIQLVWEAWTKAEILDQWWASEGWKSNTKTMKFEEGGMRHYLMRGPEDVEHWGITSYLKIQVHASFSGKECFADENAVISDEFPPSDYRISFFDKGEQTFIEHHTIYDNFDQLEQSLQYGFKEGMLDAFDRLDDHLG